MSKILLDFADELLSDITDGSENYQTVMGLVMIAWNMALLTEEEQEAGMKNLIEKMEIKKAGDRRDLLNLMKMLILKSR